MSKTVISIKVSELPQSVLKQLLHYCGSESLEAEHDSTSENQQSIDFLYNYNIDLSREQSDAIAAATSKQDIEEEIVAREAWKKEQEELRREQEQERKRNARKKRNESTRKKAPKPEAPQAGDTDLGSSFEEKTRQAEGRSVHALRPGRCPEQHFSECKDRQKQRQSQG